MGKILKFVNSCKDCRYNVSEMGSCVNEKYIKEPMRYIEKGRCPHFKERVNE
ncbi:MAG: hypothetical protein RR460_04285 [Clostridium sp.]